VLSLDSEGFDVVLEALLTGFLIPGLQEKSERKLVGGTSPGQLIKFNLTKKMVCHLDDVE